MGFRTDLIDSEIWECLERIHPLVNKLIAENYSSETVMCALFAEVGAFYKVLKETGASDKEIKEIQDKAYIIAQHSRVKEDTRVVKTGDPPDSDNGDYIIQNFIKKGDICIDIGCGGGGWSKPLAEAGAKVYGFDIEPDNVFDLQRYIDRDGLDIHAFPIGIFSENNFFKTAEHADFNCRWVTVDEFVKKIDLESLRFIKVDIEGAELDALTGAQETLKRFKPIVQVETHPDRVENLHQRLFELMDELGFKVIKENTTHNQKWIVWSDEKTMKEAGFEFTEGKERESHAFHKV